VLVLVNDPDWRTPAIGKAAGPFNGRAITYYGRYTYKYEEALRQGAAAALVIHDDEPTGYPWGVIGTGVGRPSLGLDQGSAAQPVLQYQGWITRKAAARVLANAGHDLAWLEQAATRPDFRAITTGLTGSLTLDNTVERSVSHNVVGLLPGTKRPDEVVLVTAHWDHVGRCKADASGDDICNGALDNASGTAGVLALAGHFAQRYAQVNGLPQRGLSPAAQSLLLGHPWPGNVRELENALHRAVLLAEGREIGPDAIELLAAAPFQAVAEATVVTLSSPRPLTSAVAALVGRKMEEVERDLILETLGRCLGNRTRAAEILGISIRTLRNKLHEYRGQGVAVPPAASQLAPGELMPLERG
jgi:hypothetical protein